MVGNSMPNSQSVKRHESSKWRVENSKENIVKCSENLTVSVYTAYTLFCVSASSDEHEQNTSSS